MAEPVGMAALVVSSISVPSLICRALFGLRYGEALEELVVQLVEEETAPSQVLVVQVALVVSAILVAVPMLNKKEAVAVTVVRAGWRSPVVLAARVAMVAMVVLADGCSCTLCRTPIWPSWRSSISVEVREAVLQTAEVAALAVPVVLGGAVVEQVLLVPSAAAKPSTSTCSNWPAF